ncbi:DUF2637 domain-containing protein [Streptomyces sp. DSM 44918]|uniref:DUF2637 domain-containing protein n=1 Tax=Streptomyces millisiae TaxID=3075542 RepID=A0ABU2LU11_9ACTN|nr:DUF2637 domain-containing protein [Streptomyces sp. DSM 44918]MDT0321085.1 DUF2637 domain-containing protein [Streptomyces sp. DSM 44918]
MAAIKLTRPHRILVGIILAGAVLIAAIGFVGSYTAVKELAEEKGFGAFSPFFPIGVDAGIVVLLALDLLLTWLRIPFPLLRQTAWLLTAATIAFNAASAWGDPLAVGMHGIIPVLFIITIEAARHAIGRVADITADKHMEGVRMWRWVLSPIPTFRLWRRMKLWELRSYEEVIAMERDRLVYQTRLRADYGRAWRRRAPVEALMPLKLARYGVPLQGAEPAFAPPGPAALPVAGGGVAAVNGGWPAGPATPAGNGQPTGVNGAHGPRAGLPPTGTAGPATANGGPAGNGRPEGANGAWAGQPPTGTAGRATVNADPAGNGQPDAANGPWAGQPVSAGPAGNGQPEGANGAWGGQPPNIGADAAPLDDGRPAGRNDARIGQPAGAPGAPAATAANAGPRDRFAEEEAWWVANQPTPDVEAEVEIDVEPSSGVSVPVGAGDRRRPLGGSTVPEEPAPSPADDPEGAARSETFYAAYRLYVQEQGVFPNARQLSRFLHERQGITDADGALLSEPYLREFTRGFRERYGAEMGTGV